MSGEQLESLYEDLKREYDLTLERRKTLTGQAASLVSFAAIIQTILVALLTALATNKDARSLLIASPHYSLLVGAAEVGFSAYILTAVFSLMGFREPKWYRIPRMPDPDPLDTIDFFYKNPAKYEQRLFALQLSEATTRHQATNRRKYWYLRAALIALLAGIIATAAAGFILLMAIS